MAEAKTTTIDTLPTLRLLDAERGYTQRNEALSSFARDYFSGKVGLIHILEAGCGRKWRLDLGDIKYSLTGVDISKEALDLRKANEGDLDRAIVGDLRTVKLDAEQFDIVYSADVIEHVNGAEEVVAKFFTWLKPKGLLMLVFPDRDTVFGFMVRMLPYWAHVLYYRYVIGSPTAGKPGFNPFPTYYDRIVSRRAIHDYCRRHGHSIVLEYGRPYDFKKLGWLALGARFVFRFIHLLSFGRLAADHSGLVCIIRRQ